MEAVTSATGLVLTRFGGVNALARALGKTPSTIQRWKVSGTIPLEHWPAVSQAAFNEGFYDITVHWLGEVHASQSLRDAAIKSQSEDDKAAKLGVA